MELDALKVGAVVKRSAENTVQSGQFDAAQGCQFEGTFGYPSEFLGKSDVLKLRKVAFGTFP